VQSLHFPILDHHGVALAAGTPEDGAAVEGEIGRGGEAGGGVAEEADLEGGGGCEVRG
jgi:hypothetical protein